jgi:hypothetical protein
VRIRGESEENGKRAVGVFLSLYSIRPPLFVSFVVVLSFSFVFFVSFLCLSFLFLSFLFFSFFFFSFISFIAILVYWRLALEVSVDACVQMLAVKNGEANEGAISHFGRLSSSANRVFRRPLAIPIPIQRGALSSLFQGLWNASLEWKSLFAWRGCVRNSHGRCTAIGPHVIANPWTPDRSGRGSVGRESISAIGRRSRSIEEWRAVWYRRREGKC